MDLLRHVISDIHPCGTGRGAGQSSGWPWRRKQHKVNAAPALLQQSIANPLFEAPAGMGISAQQMGWSARQGFQRLDSGISGLSLEQDPNKMSSTPDPSGFPDGAGQTNQSFLGRILSKKGSTTYGPDYRSHR